MEWFILAWRRCTVFRGRAHRTEFWMFALLALVVWFALCLMVAMFFQSEPEHPAVWWLLLGITVTSALPLASVSARRLHDTGRSGWYQLIGWIPLVGPPTVLVLLAMPGATDENLYGPVPMRRPEAPRGAAADAMPRDPLAAERQRLREKFGLSAPVVSRPLTVTVPPAADPVWQPKFLSGQPWMMISAFAALEVLLVGVVGFRIAQRLGFHVLWLTPVSGLLYAAAGFASARAAGSSAMAGVIMAMADAVFVFLASGIGPVPEIPDRGPAAFLSAFMATAVPGTLASMSGGWLSKRLRPRPAA
jgi:uncharacterized membrane protein YhaH (DUF805 family)